MITEELKDKLNIEFRMDISHMFLGYENNMPLDEFNRMLDILVNKAIKIFSEVGVQPEVIPKIADKVTRLVIIDHRKDIKPYGRIIDKWGVKVNCILQDDNRTLKIFITD